MLLMPQQQAISCDFKEISMTTKTKIARTSSNTKMSAQTIVATADRLVEQREQWQQNEYARSNARLYEILSSVLAMWQQVKDDKELRIETVKQMKAALTAAGVRVQMNTLALPLFVRYVFRTDRNRAMNYSRTLQAALAADIDSKDLADFIERSGGVEECKRQMSKSEAVLAKEQAIESAMTLVEEQLENSYNSPLATFKVSPDYVQGLQSGYVFLMARASSKGEIRALAVVPSQSEGMTKWAKQQMALFLSQQSVKAAKNAKVKRKNSAIETAAKSKTPTVCETVGDLVAA
jgi:hypothetical protein